MSKAVKINIYKTMAEPVAVQGGKKRAVSEMDITRLGKWERKMLRRIHKARNMESEN